MVDSTIDITREHCPMTFVKTKLSLEKLQTGQRLEVLLRKGEPLENVPRSAEEQGYKVLSQEHIEDDIYRLIIER